MSYTVFDPIAVKANLRGCLKGREKDKASHNNQNGWLVNWTTDWTDKALNKTLERWKEAGCTGSVAQMRYAAEVLKYMKILHRSLLGHNGQSNPLPASFPLYGPVFSPPTVEYASMRPQTNPTNPFEPLSSRAERTVARNPEQYLIEPIQVVSPVFYPDLPLGQCPVDGCQDKTQRKSFTSTGFRTIYGLAANLKVIGMEYFCPTHKKYTTTSPEKFWKKFKPWQIDGIPHFHSRSGCTRELFDFIVELRPRLSVGEMVESIRQLHLLYNRRREKAWLALALRERSQGLLKDQEEIVRYPQELMRHTGENSTESINPWPSESMIRVIYEDFIERQRREESERYSRTLAGLNIGLDATLKIAKKANIYTQGGTADKKTSQVSNVFEGGLLTGVNEDKELVIWEFLYGNSPIEMAAPLLEYAGRCDKLGVNFRHDGEACVDRCCDFRASVQAALPGLTVVQDLAHLKNRIMDTVSKRSPHRDRLAKDVTRAFLSRPADGKGHGAEYRPKQEQVEHLQLIWTKYDKLEDVWSADSHRTFPIQLQHAKKGCMERRHPGRPSHTSANENWHSRLNGLTRGNASSLTTIDALLTDGVLRFNLMVDIYNLSQPFDSPSCLFHAAARGSHHIFLLEHILRQTEQLTGIAQPQFLNIFPEHHFGLVPRDPKFIGLTFDRYKNLRESLQRDTEIKGEGAEIILTTTFNGESDEGLTLELEQYLPPPSPGLVRRPKRKHSEPSEGTKPDECTPSLIPPTKVQRVENESKSLLFETGSFSHSQPSNFPSKPLFPIFAQAVGSPASLLKDKPIVGPSPVVDSMQDISPVIADVAPASLSLGREPASLRPEKKSNKSRTSSTFTRLSGASATNMIATTHIENGSAGYWRFAALRLQYHWSSQMTDKQFRFPER